MRTRRQGAGKARRAVPLGLPVPRPKAPQATPQVGLRLLKPHLPRFYAETFRQGLSRSSKRVSAIERKLAKLEEQKADLEQQMAAHDPSDYEGLGKLNDQLQAVTDESEELELEWMELSEQLE